jgi:hypothetical protein
MFNWLKNLRKDTREKIVINVAKDFTDSPGCRYPDESDFSGEWFRESLLFPKFKEAVLSDKILVINLDGCFGYACAFLDEAFGGLIRVHDVSLKVILYKIEIITLEEPGLEEEIMEYLKKADKEDRARK